MKVFISWSGGVSHEIGQAVYEWLPNVLQAVEPYFTPSDIDKGARWSSEIAENLRESNYGIVIVTRQNLDAPWIMFEAGALSKEVGDAHVSPVLFGIEQSDVVGPLAQFQSTEFEEKDVRKLVQSINNCANDQLMPPDRLDRVFTKWWPELMERVAEITSRTPDDGDAESRTEREILGEVLENTRALLRENSTYLQQYETALRRLDRAGVPETPNVSRLRQELEHERAKTRRQIPKEVLEETLRLLSEMGESHHGITDEDASEKSDADSEPERFRFPADG